MQTQSLSSQFSKIGSSYYLIPFDRFVADGVSSGAVYLYCYLLTLANQLMSNVFPSPLSDASVSLRLTSSTVRRYLKELQSLGYIKIRRVGLTQPNEITLLNFMEV